MKNGPIPSLVDSQTGQDEYGLPTTCGIMSQTLLLDILKDKFCHQTSVFLSLCVRICISHKRGIFKTTGNGYLRKLGVLGRDSIFILHSV